MGAPSVNIAFIEKSATAIQRGERGTIAMLLKESAVTTADYVVYSVTDIPSNLSEANKTAVKQALTGYQTAPKKILLHLIKAVLLSQMDIRCTCLFCNAEVGLSGSTDCGNRYEGN